MDNKDNAHATQRAAVIDSSPQNDDSGDSGKIRNARTPLLTRDGGKRTYSNERCSGNRERFPNRLNGCNHQGGTGNADFKFKRACGRTGKGQMPSNAHDTTPGLCQAGKSNLKADFALFPSRRTFGDCPPGLGFYLCLKRRRKLGGTLPKRCVVLLRPFGNLPVNILFSTHPFCRYA